MLTNKFLKVLLPVSIFAIIIVISYKQKHELYQLLKDTKINWLLIGLLFYFINYVTRTIRLQHLARNKRLSFWVGLKTSSLHGYYSYFLPFRTGDISLLFLLKEFSKVTLTTGGSILVRARLLDMFSLGIFLFFSVLLSHSVLNNQTILLFILASVTLTGVPFMIILFISKGKEIQIKWINSVANDISQYPLSLKEIGLSLLIWFWTGCTLFSATEALSIPIKFMDIWFLVAIQLPLQLFPIQGVANTGNHELGWVTGFTLLGFTSDIGLRFAIASHVILVTYVLIIGVIGYFIPARDSINPHVHSASE